MFWKNASFKMLYLIGPDGLVNQGLVNFQKMVWMIIDNGTCPSIQIKHQKSSADHAFNSHSCCFLEVCIPLVYKVSKIYQVCQKQHLKIFVVVITKEVLAGKDWEASNSLNQFSISPHLGEMEASQQYDHGSSWLHISSADAQQNFNRYITSQLK